MFLAVVTNESQATSSSEGLWDEAVDRLVGLTIVSPTWGNRDLPLPHLEAFRSDYTALDGILLDIEYAESAAEALFDFIQNSSWHGLGFEVTHVGSEQANLLQKVADRRGIEWSEQYRWQRAVMPRSTAQNNYEMTAISRNRHKKLCRKQRRLKRCGRYEFRIHREPIDCMHAAEHFLELEAMGWKGENRSAMTCDRDRRDFYLKMVFDFARPGRIFFTDIVLNGQLIPLSCNLLSAASAFAFKIGWNSKFGVYSPGLLNAFEKTQAMSSELSDLSLFDSSAQPGSYLEQIWPDRISCAKGQFICSSMGRAAAFAVRQARRLKRQLKPLRTHTNANSRSLPSRQQELDA